MTSESNLQIGKNVCQKFEPNLWRRDKCRNCLASLNDHLEPKDFAQNIPKHALEDDANDQNSYEAINSFQSSEGKGFSNTQERPTSFDGRSNEFVRAVNSDPSMSLSQVDKSAARPKSMSAVWSGESAKQLAPVKRWVMGEAWKRRVSGTYNVDPRNIVLSPPDLPGHLTVSGSSPSVGVVNMEDSHAFENGKLSEESLLHPQEKGAGQTHHEKNRQVEQPHSKQEHSYESSSSDSSDDSEHKHTEKEIEKEVVNSADYQHTLPTLQTIDTMSFIDDLPDDSVQIERTQVNRELFVMPSNISKNIHAQSRPIGYNSAQGKDEPSNFSHKLPIQQDNNANIKNFGDVWLFY